MQVETYEIPEVDCEGNIESDEEAIALINELGLEGQQSLVNPEDSGARCPYRKMTKSEAQVYELILPQKTNIRDYTDGMIPLRVLQVASHAVEFFDHLVVWHPQNADIKDPVLVGVNGSLHSSSQERFLLARWGDELIPLESLIPKAAEAMRGALKRKYAEIRNTVDAKLAGLEAAGDEAVLSMRAPSFYE